MKKLNKMLLREILRNRGQFIAAAAVVFAGITMFSAAYMAYCNLKNSLETYYRQYRFLDYYAEARAIPTGLIRRIQEIKGVRTAAGRISVDVGADMGDDKRVTVRLISLPDHHRPEINDLVVVGGRYIRPGNPDACLVGQKFADFYRLGRGDRIKAIINRGIHEFRIDGVAASPEFIYAMKSSSSISPSAEYFGLVFVKESTIRRLTGFDDYYNQVHVIFQENADRKQVIHRIETMLKPYGWTNGVERKDQLSHNTVNNEINELEQIAFMFPALFLSVAAMMIYIMQRRIINNQRTLIGVMKAFGYSNPRIIGHYLLYALLIAVAGSIPAAFAGIYLGGLMTGAYRGIFNIPMMQIKIYWDVLVIGTGLSTGFSLLAGWNSAKRITSILPAQAMRSEVPHGGRRVFLERIGILWRRLSFSWKMSLRNIFRSPQRTFFTLMGIVFTIMFFMLTLFFQDVVGYILNQHFFAMQKQDYKVVFAYPAAYQDALELKTIQGIRRSEPILEVPMELKNGWMKKDTMTVGLMPKQRFYRLIDRERNLVSPPKRGILIAHTLAEKLMIQEGDQITVRPYIGRAEEKEVVVAGIVKEYAGFNCYMSLRELGDLIGEGKCATGALIKTAPGSDKKIKQELFKQPGVETVEGRVNTYRSFEEMMVFTKALFGFMIAFGSVMGFSIIFNTTVINVMERRRELASLKVLGYRRWEIERTIFRENMLVGLAALGPGIVLGKAMCEFFGKHFSNELFAMEVIIFPKTYIITLVCVFAFLVLAQWANRKNITGLDMVEVLKNKEG